MNKIEKFALEHRDGIKLSLHCFMAFTGAITYGISKALNDSYENEEISGVKYAAGVVSTITACTGMLYGAIAADQAIDDLIDEAHVKDVKDITQSMYKSHTETFGEYKSTLKNMYGEHYDAMIQSVTTFEKNLFDYALKDCTDGESVFYIPLETYWFKGNINELVRNGEFTKELNSKLKALGMDLEDLEIISMPKGYYIIA